jgi:DNA mismatch repair protein MutL
MPALVQGVRSIQVLPPEVVERIAAGEVIERPVSVVRELLDNALDAGASEIRIDIRGGGLRMVRVADNGSGIPAAQIDLAVRHHATSKIRVASDLLALESLGFRGEALPSVAAVSELTILSANGNSLGVELVLRFGIETGRALRARTPGTTVIARNLFTNLPARLKFISSARAESTLIGQLVRRYALAHPGVRFHLTLDGHPSLRTSGVGLDQTIGEVFGASIAAGLLPLGPLRSERAEWYGYVTGQQITRASRAHISLFVNGRSVGSRSMLAAFEEGYRPVLPRGRHPIAVLFLSVPRGAIDVNVHPSKAEVKVHDERDVTDALKHLTRETLGRRTAIPPDRRYSLGTEQSALPLTIAEERPVYMPVTQETLRSMRVVGQVHGSLILAESETGMFLIDQHRAHERSIYELLLRRHSEGRAGQLLLEPIHVELSARQLAALEPRLAELAELGFQCEWFGGRSFLIRGIPTIPETANLPRLLDDLLELAGGDTDWQHRLLTAVACHSATRRGRQLSLPQCRELLDILAECEAPAVCPHGSPIILHFDQRFLERQFDW